MRINTKSMMRRLISFACFTSAAMFASAVPVMASGKALVATKKPNFHFAKDLSDVRGFNYNTASSQNYPDEWNNYNHEEVDRDMGYAQGLNLNAARVFLSYTAWMKDKAAFRAHLIDFVRTCNAHNIGAMIVLVDLPRGMMPDLFEESAKPQLREWAKDMYDAVGKEPGLAFWDVANEPDLIRPPGFMPNTNQQQRIAVGVYMASVFHEFDHHTPVTIGCLFLTCTIQTASAVDVMSFHDYSQTRAQIHADIVRAQELSAKVGKPIFTTEMGCTGRANPYDVEIQEHEKSHMGWFIWELMVAHGWGPIHGVFYPDGTVRDPAISSAIMGFYRNRGANVVLEQADREGWVTRALFDAKDWLAASNPDWFEGLETAETEANLLEANQLVAMRELPTRKVDLLRAGQPNLEALRTLIQEFTTELAPAAKPGQKPANPSYKPTVVH
jgi:hypothetical protein